MVKKNFPKSEPSTMRSKPQAQVEGEGGRWFVILLLACKFLVENGLNGFQFPDLGRTRPGGLLL